MYYYYRRTMNEPFYTVGRLDYFGYWVVESYHERREEAAARARELNNPSDHDIAADAADYDRMAREGLL